MHSVFRDSVEDGTTVHRDTEKKKGKQQRTRTKQWQRQSQTVYREAGGDVRLTDVHINSTCKKKQNGRYLPDNVYRRRGKTYRATSSTKRYLKERTLNESEKPFWWPYLCRTKTENSCKNREHYIEGDNVARFRKSADEQRVGGIFPVVLNKYWSSVSGS